jgi:hypothetical protein
MMLEVAAFAFAVYRFFVSVITAMIITAIIPVMTVTMPSVSAITL